MGWAGGWGWGWCCEWAGAGLLGLGLGLGAGARGCLKLEPAFLTETSNSRFKKDSISWVSLGAQ